MFEGIKTQLNNIGDDVKEGVAHGERTNGKVAEQEARWQRAYGAGGLLAFLIVAVFLPWMIWQTKKIIEMSENVSNIEQTLANYDK
jgi:hypothetical protein